MSRLTPNKPMTDAQLQAALDVIANFTMTLEQAEKLTRAITIEEEESIFAPCIDDIADQFYKADMATQSEYEVDELPYMGATIGSDDQPRGFA